MLVIQDPSDQTSEFLLEAILETVENATAVGCAFAFASASGVRLLAGSSTFQQILHCAAIDIIVGVDAVTDTAAVREMQRIAQHHKGVAFKAFVTGRPNAIFHPKLLWSEKPGGGNIVIGSGNLTERGLLKNWEAYWKQGLSVVELKEIRATWQRWIDQSQACIKPIDDPLVAELAQNNTVLAVEGDLPVLDVHVPVAPPVVPETRGSWISSTSPVLIAEISKSGDRGSQVNFHKQDYEDYFGVSGQAGQLVVFRHIQADGAPEPYETSRPPVTVASQNYRFELSAMVGKVYPVKGRPIGVYVRVAARTFWYHLLMPEDAEYYNVENLLPRDNAGRLMRTLRMSAGDMTARWPGNPFAVAGQSLG